MTSMGMPALTLLPALLAELDLVISRKPLVIFLVIFLVEGGGANALASIGVQTFVITLK